MSLWISMSDHYCLEDLHTNIHIFRYKGDITEECEVIEHDLFIKQSLPKNVHFSVVRLTKTVLKIAGCLKCILLLTLCSTGGEKIAFINYNTLIYSMTKQMYLNWPLTTNNKTFFISFIIHRKIVFKNQIDKVVVIVILWW